MIWGRRRKPLATPAKFSFHNQRAEPLALWLEPWAEEHVVAPGSLLEIVLSGRFAEPADAVFEQTAEHLVFFAPNGSTVAILIDGDEVSNTDGNPVPDVDGFDSRSFVHMVFDQFPQARASGQSATGLALAGLGDAIVDRDIRLEPLAEAHRAALKAACAEDLDIWPIYAISYDPEHFDESFDKLRARPNVAGFAIFLDDRLVGMSCFLAIEPERGVLEIGNTYYIPEVRGTGFNRRVKDLMLRRAFGCGFRRVEFKVDSRNARSQAAMAKLGATREGVIRADRITWNGHVRDTVLFSILAGEWGDAR